MHRRMLQGPPACKSRIPCKSGPRAGYYGYKRKRGSKVHIAVDTLEQLLAEHVTPDNGQERAQVAARSNRYVLRVSDRVF
jgi:hypothetical protein